MRTALRGLACLLAFAALPFGAPASEPAALPGDSVYQFRAELADAAGNAVEWQDLRGRPRIATMFYASCRYACPLVIDSLRSIERQLPAAERDQLGIVLITMDPQRDTPKALAGVVSERRLDPARWRLLRPQPADLRGLAGVLGIRYRATGNGEFNHSNALVLLDPEGRVLARTERLGADAAFVAAARAAATAESSPARASR